MAQRRCSALEGEGRRNERESAAAPGTQRQAENDLAAVGRVAAADAVCGSAEARRLAHRRVSRRDLLAAGQRVRHRHREEDRDVRDRAGEESESVLVDPAQGTGVSRATRE